MHVCGEENAMPSAPGMALGGMSGGTLLSPSESAGGAGSLKKRKSFDFNLVSEKMKRCRIAVSPGELRLRRDLEEFAALQAAGAAEGQGLRVMRMMDPLVVQVHFDPPGQPPGAPPTQPPAPLGSPHAGSPTPAACPGLFTVKVPRFYPHQPPVAIALDAALHGRVPCVGAGGQVLHPLLQKDWSSVMTFKEVLQALRCVHDMCAGGRPPPPPRGFAGMHVCS
jgi:hypothetical protein